MHIPRVIDRLLASRRFALPLERIFFLTLLHRLFASGNGRSCVLNWKDRYGIPGTEAIDLHHVYRDMAWRGEPLPEHQQAGATPFAPRCTKDDFEEPLTRQENRMNGSNQQELAKKAYSLGFQYEKQYSGCAQCVIAALQDVLQLRDERSDAVLKAATSLEGGVGCEGDGHCGAYSGTVMILGYVMGRERDNLADPEAKRQQTNAMAQALHQRFIERYGTVICHGIQRNIFGRPYYLKDSTESAKFKAAGAHVDKCTAVVGEAARWAVEILFEAGELP